MKMDFLFYELYPLLNVYLCQDSFPLVYASLVATITLFFLCKLPSYLKWVVARAYPRLYGKFTNDR